ncbi:MAG: hypothetical protein AAGN82_08130 [Myxococcota bacterium]
MGQRTKGRVATGATLLLMAATTATACGQKDDGEVKDRAAEKDRAKKKKKDERKEKKKEREEKKAEAKSDGTAKPAVATPEASASAAPSASAEAVDVACGALNEIPAIPGGSSTPPTQEEWSGACAVNTQGANSHPDDCEMKVMREWLRVSCRGKYYKVQNRENFGAKGVDYFEMLKPNEIISYTLKLKKDRNQKVRFCRTDNKRASLFVSWPSSSPKPLHLALARGPACD